MGWGDGDGYCVEISAWWGLSVGGGELGVWIVCTDWGDFGGGGGGWDAGCVIWSGLTGRWVGDWHGEMVRWK
jgi:hypothetical protein